MLLPVVPNAIDMFSCPMDGALKKGKKFARSRFQVFGRKIPLASARGGRKKKELWTTPKGFGRGDLRKQPGREKKGLAGGGEEKKEETFFLSLKACDEGNV